MLLYVKNENIHRDLRVLKYGSRLVDGERWGDRDKTKRIFFLYRRRFSKMRRNLKIAVIFKNVEVRLPIETEQRNTKHTELKQLVWYECTTSVWHKLDKASHELDSRILKEKGHLINEE